MGTIYYLNRDSSDSAISMRSLTLYNHLHTEEIQVVPNDDFEELYKKMGEVEETDIQSANESWREQLSNETRSIDVGDIIRTGDSYHMLYPDEWKIVKIE